MLALRILIVSSKFLLMCAINASTSPLSRQSNTNKCLILNVYAEEKKGDENRFPTRDSLTHEKFWRRRRFNLMKHRLFRLFDTMKKTHQLRFKVQLKTSQAYLSNFRCFSTSLSFDPFTPSSQPSWFSLITTTNEAYFTFHWLIFIRLSLYLTLVVTLWWSLTFKITSPSLAHFISKLSQKHS